MQTVAEVFGLKTTRSCLCDICLVFKARAPSASTTPTIKRASKAGQCVHLDHWSYRVEAVIKGFTGILGAVDEALDLFDVIGTKEPNGKMTSDFLKYLWILYGSEYRTELICVRIDNGSIFDCEEFKTMAAQLKVRIELTAPYLHFQLRIERHWQTMKRDAACMLAAARRPKNLYIFACLHAAMIRCVTRLSAEKELGDDVTQSVSNYELQTGKAFPLDALRMWGASAFGTMLPEQRKGLRLDKADPYAVQGIYIGNVRESRTFLIIDVTRTHKIHSMGAAMINEKEFLKNVSGGNVSTYADIIDEDEIRGEDKVYSFDGIDQGPVVDSSKDVSAGQNQSESVGNQSEPVQNQSEQAPTRPKRDVQPTIKFADEAVKPQLAKSKPTAAKVCEKAMVPRQTWPRYTCKENGGAGWSVEITSKQKDRVRVRFTEARDGRGAPWCEEWMRAEMLVPLPSSPSTPSDTPSEMSRAQLSSHAIAFADQQVAAGLVRATLESMENEKSNTIALEPDDEMMKMSASMDNRSKDMMVMLAHLVKPNDGMKYKLLTIRGVPLWYPVPSTVKQAKQLPNWPRFRIAMDTFMARTIDGLLPVAPSMTRGKPISRVKWVFDYKTDDNGDPLEKARLVWAHNENNRPGGSEFKPLTMSNVVKPMHWKMLIHVALVDGAKLKRFDIANAHQSSRRSPNDPPAYSYPIPDCPMYTADGEEANVQWMNMLNGMPEAGNAFEKDLAAVTANHGMRSVIQDDLVWVHNITEIYLKLAFNVDDILCAYKDDAADKYEKHLNKRWKVKSMGLDGWLGNQFYPNPEQNTMTITMDVRLCEYMKEWLPNEMEKEPPPTPYHPELMSLSMEGTLLSADEGKKAHRICAQLLYCVTTVYLNAQWCIYYIARYTSHPTKLYKDCLLHALRHLFGTRHIGLTLGGVGDGQLQSTAHAVTPDDERHQTGSHSDAGHAEPGPSTGGHTQDMGDTTIHSYSGQHHLTTLCTTDAEGYELSRAVASLMGTREFACEIGYPQVRPSPAFVDNSGALFKATQGKADKKGMYMRKRVKFLQEAERWGVAAITKIRTDDNRADILTKMLSTKLYKKMRDKILNVKAAALNIHAIVRHQLGKWWD